MPTFPNIIGVLVTSIIIVMFSTNIVGTFSDIGGGIDLNLDSDLMTIIIAAAVLTLIGVVARGGYQIYTTGGGKAAQWVTYGFIAVGCVIGVLALVAGPDVATDTVTAVHENIRHQTKKANECLKGSCRDEQKNQRRQLTVVPVKIPEREVELDPKLAADNCVLGRFTIDLDKGDVFIRHFQDTKLYSRRAFDGKTFKAESLVPAGGKRPDQVLNFGGNDIPVVWETGLGPKKTVYTRRYFGSGKAVMVREAARGKEKVACRPRKNK